MRFKNWDFWNFEIWVFGKRVPSRQFLSNKDESGEKSFWFHARWAIIWNLFFWEDCLRKYDFLRNEKFRDKSSNSKKNILSLRLQRNKSRAVGQGCQMVYFQTKNPIWDKIWRALEWKRLFYSLAIYIEYRYYGHLVQIMAIFLVM
jgi:hypothetical protein